MHSMVTDLLMKQKRNRATRLMLGFGYEETMFKMATDMQVDKRCYK